jgi:hypothetical protein
MQRRDFLKATGAVLSSAPLVTLAGAAAKTSVPSTGIRIHEKFITNDRVGVVTLAQAIVGGCYRFLGSTQAEFYMRFADPHDLETRDNSAYLLWADDGEQPWLLDFNLSESPFPGAKKEGLAAWLTAFHPRNCNDWLMVPTLYSRHIYDTESINWRNPPEFPQMEHVDELLSVTRGVLLWPWQAERLTQQYCNVSRLEATALWRRYIRRDECAVQRMNESTYDGRSLADVIEERTLEQTLSVVPPDYRLAGFLSELLQITNRRPVTDLFT